MSDHSPERLLLITNSEPDSTFLSRLMTEGYDVQQAMESELADLQLAEFMAAILFPESSDDISTPRLHEVEGHLPVLLRSDLFTQIPDALDPQRMIWPIAADVDGSHLRAAIDLACAQFTLRHQLQHYRDLLESAPVGVFKIENGSLTYVNEYLLDRMGYSLDQIRSIPLEELFVPEDREQFHEALQNLPKRAIDAPPNVYRFIGADGQIFIGEVRSRLLQTGHGSDIEGTIRDITQETRIMQLHRVVLELTEVILAEQEIDAILQLVLDTIVEYSGFRRALLTLYDLSVPTPFEGAVYKTLTSGLTDEECDAVLSQPPVPIEQRKAIYSGRYQLGPAYYIPHEDTPWSNEHGISGTLAVEGWHPDDFLFIPLRGGEGIIGSISVDDPIDQSVPTVSSIEPVAFLANFAAFAVERVFKMKQMRKQADRLHGLAAFGAELANVSSERALCQIASKHVQDAMGYDACGIWLVDGIRFVHEASAAVADIPLAEIPEPGARVLAEGPGINRWVLQHNEPKLIRDTTEDPLYNGTRESLRSYLALPIAGRKSPIGVFYAASQRLAAFDTQDLEILSTVTSHLSTALSATRRRDALNRIFAFGQHLAVASNKSQAVTSTLDFLIEQFDFQLSSILMVQDDGQLLVEGVAGAYPESRVKRGSTMGFDSGVIGWVARSKQSAIVRNVSDDDRYFEVFSDTNSELAVPILLSDQLLGVINIESPQPSFFDEEDRRLIEVVANQLAIALTNISAQDDLREQAIRDPLTGLFNRHYFNSIIASELNRSDRYNHPLSLMMIDVDGFRAVNNQLGHLMGDEVLQRVARMLEAGVRDADRVIRYGGDEFLILMPETNGHGDSELVATRLRQEIGTVLEGTEADKLGLSIGIYARHPREDKTMEEILEEVDRRMYSDKRARNEDRADDYRG